MKSMISKRNLHDINIIPYAAYDRHTVLKYDMTGGMDSRIAQPNDRYSSDNIVQLQTTTIDDVVGNDTVTYIKMDIEGSEMEALHGAEQTIKRCKPVCGISAYHKQDDIVNIYSLLKKWHSDYKFYFRNHRPMEVDAVLYAVP